MTRTKIPAFAFGWPELAEHLSQAMLPFYCCNCYRKRETVYITPNFGPFCDECLRDARIWQSAVKLPTHAPQCGVKDGLPCICSASPPMVSRFTDASGRNLGTSVSGAAPRPDGPWKGQQMIEDVKVRCKWCASPFMSRFAVLCGEHMFCSWKCGQAWERRKV